MKKILAYIDRVCHWRHWLIRHRLFDLLDKTLLSNTHTYYPIPALIKQEWQANSSYRELVNIYRILKLTEHLDGDIAELGVFRGGTSKLMALTCPHKTVHMFDTFEGIPCKDEKYDGMNIGDCKASLHEVKRYLQDIPNVVFHPGLFPNTASSLQCNFSFVNLDADQYQSTLDALSYFYPRILRGGIIMLHDYTTKCTKGIEQAVLQYKKQQALMCIPIWDSQAIIVKF